MFERLQNRLHKKQRPLLSPYSSQSFVIMLHAVRSKEYHCPDNYHRYAFVKPPYHYAMFCDEENSYVGHTGGTPFLARYIMSLGLLNDTRITHTTWVSERLSLRQVCISTVFCFWLPYFDTTQNISLKKVFWLIMIFLVENTEEL